MIRVKRKTLIWSYLGIGLFVIISIIGLMSVFAKNIDINVSKERIDKGINSQLPLTKVVDIKSKIPTSFPTAFKNIYNPVVEVTNVKTTYLEDKINIVADAKLKFKTKTYNLKIDSTGAPVYKDKSFFYKADSFKIIQDKTYIDMLKDIYSEKVAANQDKINKKLEDSVNKLTNKIGIGKGFFNKIVSDKVSDNKIKEFMTNKIFENKELNEEISLYIDTKVQNLLVQGFAKYPIYKLKDSLAENTIKIGLESIHIDKDGLTLSISVEELFLYGAISLSVFILILFLIYYTIKNPTDVLFGVFEVVSTVAESTLEATGDVLGGL